MKTPQEAHMELLGLHVEALTVRLQEVQDLIRAGKPLRYGHHVADIENIAYRTVESLKFLAPGPATAEPENNRLQQVVQETIEEYVADKELDQILLGGDRENFEAKFFETETVWKNGDADFSIPEALLENHRAEIIERITDAITEECAGEFVELEFYDGETTDSRLEIE